MPKLPTKINNYRSTLEALAIELFRTPTLVNPLCVFSCRRHER